MSSSEEKLKYEGEVMFPQCLSHLESITAGMRRGRLQLSHGGRSLTLRPGGLVQLEIKAKSTRDKRSLRLDLSWRPESEPAPDPRQVAALMLQACAQPPIAQAIVAAEPSTDAEAPQQALIGPAVVATPGSEPVDATDDPATSVASILDGFTRERLYEKARQLEVDDRSTMDKQQLIEALVRQAASLDELFTHEELYGLAREVELPGRSSMSKAELLDMLCMQLAAASDSKQ